MKKSTKWVIIGAVALLAALIALFFFFFLPYHHARSEMPAGAVLTLDAQRDGSFRLSWPAAEGADYYSVEVLRPGEKEEELLYADFVKDGVSCVLSGLPQQEKLLLRVNSVVEYDEDDPEKVRMGENPVEVNLTFQAPKIENLTWEADEAADTVRLDYTKAYTDDCRIYVKSGENWQPLKTLGGDQVTVSFGENGDLPMIPIGGSVVLGLDAFRVSENLEFSGCIENEITVTREDLLGRELNLQLQDQGRNVAKLTWEETKGEYYAVQMRTLDGEDWQTLAEIPLDAELTFTTHHLPVVQSILLRVVAMGGQTMEKSEFAAESQHMVYATTESPIYATIWPTGNLKTYADPERTQEVGKVKAAAAYCVLDEIGDSFAIGVDGQTVYIESTHCLINLLEYVGDLCSYNITNSYSSLYMVHEYEIPKVTDVVTGGYERVKMQNGEYLVPLLYPTAQKLAVAAKTAVQQGYRLKIYDAYRPNKATIEIYDRTKAILENEIPKKTFHGGTMYDLPKLPPKENEEDPDPIMTYWIVMTNNSSWALNSFLAKGASLHNYGIAVDLTLETLDGKELPMQTSIHDLSWYSVISRNNDNAKLLASIMKSAGLGELVSEWWHFQDNDIRQQVTLNCVWAGVTPECWMRDDFGWKYRRATGAYFKDGTFDIYGTLYTFDGYGYLVTE